MAVQAQELTEEQASQLRDAQLKFMKMDDELFDYTTQFDLERPSGPFIAQLLWDWSESRKALLELTLSFRKDEVE